MIRYVDNAREAALLVRRANATDKLINEALKTCGLLEEEQFELKQDMAETHLRTQRRAGELLFELEKHPGGRLPAKGTEAGGYSGKPLTLRELGISSLESHRWQRIASLPLKAFEAYIADRRSRKLELTTAAVLALAKRPHVDSDRAATAGGARMATIGEYKKARPYFQALISLDPTVLVAAMGAGVCDEEIRAVQKLRLWLDEFENELQRRSYGE
jgi:hypothetical protein